MQIHSYRECATDRCRRPAVQRVVARYRVAGGGVQGCLELAAGGRLEVIVELDPGILVGDITEFPEQTLWEIWVSDGSGSRWRREGQVPFASIGPVTASEMIRDLTEVAG